MISKTNKNIISLGSLLLFSLVLFSMPIFVHSATINGLTYQCSSSFEGVETPETAGNCDFFDLVAATQNVVTKLTILAIGFSVVVIAWAGFNYMISGDNASKRKEANEMLRKVAVGMVLIIAAWLIVSLITNALLGKTLDNIFNS